MTSPASHVMNRDGELCVTQGSQRFSQIGGLMQGVFIESLHNDFRAFWTQ